MVTSHTSGPVVAGADHPADTDPDRLLVELLGPTGLGGDPDVSHEALVGGTCDLLVRLLGFDECWLQQAGGFGGDVAAWAASSDGVWTANPVAADHRGGRLSLGSAGGVPVRCAGRPVGTLMAWSRTPRAWSSRDRKVLRAAAARLGEAMTRTAPHQRSAPERAAAELEVLRGELITTLNHELRTPLTVLCGGLDLLADGDLGDLTPAQDKLVERLERSLQRLQELAANVARLSATPVDPRRWYPGSMPVADVAEVVDDCVTAVGQRDLDLVVEPWTDPVLAGLPTSELRELLDRVLTNAVKFTPPSGRVRVAFRTRPEGRVEVVVSDTGCGVPADEQERLGGTFFRSSTARREEKQGSGLGLAAAARLAESWGGELAITATEGAGTHVCLTLPQAVREG